MSTRGTATDGLGLKFQEYLRQERGFLLLVLAPLIALWIGLFLVYAPISAATASTEAELAVLRKDTLSPENLGQRADSLQRAISTLRQLREQLEQRRAQQAGIPDPGRVRSLAQGCGVRLAELSEVPGGIRLQGEAGAREWACWSVAVSDSLVGAWVSRAAVRPLSSGQRLEIRDLELLWSMEAKP